jgi:hypothetical protein
MDQHKKCKQPFFMDPGSKQFDYFGQRRTLKFHGDLPNIRDHNAQKNVPSPVLSRSGLEETLEDLCLFSARELPQASLNIFRGHRMPR